MEVKKQIDPVLVNEWHAVYKASELKEKPVQVIVMGERIVIFRNSQGVHAFKDLCIHRGSALSLGRIENDTIVCAYHGWKYNSEGDCVCIPSQPAEQKITKRAKAIPYSCKEAYGLVWVCIGEPENFPPYNEFTDPEFRSIVTAPALIHAAAPRIIENFLDFAHFMFVHEGILGDQEHAVIPEYKVNQSEDGLTTDLVEIFQANPQWGTASTAAYVKKAMRPTVARYTKISTDTQDVYTHLMAATPVQSNLTNVSMVISRNFSLNESFDAELHAINNKIFSQDIAVLENQRPEELPLDLQAELSHPSDQMSISYRRWLSELGVEIGTV